MDLYHEKLKKDLVALNRGDYAHLRMDSHVEGAAEQFKDTKRLIFSGMSDPHIQRRRASEAQKTLQSVLNKSLNVLAELNDKAIFTSVYAYVIAYFEEYGESLRNDGEGVTFDSGAFHARRNHEKTLFKEIFKTFPVKKQERLFAQIHKFADWDEFIKKIDSRGWYVPSDVRRHALKWHEENVANKTPQEVPALENPDADEQKAISKEENKKEELSLEAQIVALGFDFNQHEKYSLFLKNNDFKGLVDFIEADRQSRPAGANLGQQFLKDRTQSDVHKIFVCISTDSLNALLRNDFENDEEFKAVIYLAMSCMLLTSNYAETGKKGRVKGVFKTTIKSTFRNFPHNKQEQIFSVLKERGFWDTFIHEVKSGNLVLPDDVRRHALQWDKENNIAKESLDKRKDLEDAIMKEEANLASLLAQRQALDEQWGRQQAAHAQERAEALKNISELEEHFANLDREIEQIEAEEALYLSENKNELTVIEVDDLLPEGEDIDDDTGIHYSRGRRSDEEPVLRVQPRIEWIVSLFEAKGFEKSDMILYKEKTTIEGFNPKRNPYQVLELQKDNHYLQIAVCEVMGNSTYVIRNPKDFEDGVVITVADLKKDAAVFQVSCYTQTQWARNINHYAFTPLENLPLQLKTRLGWADKKNAVEESFGLFYCDTQQLPRTIDTSIIEFGALAGRATWQRLYHALHSQAIKGLEHVRNFEQLRDHVFGKDFEITPKIVEPPVLEFNAKDVFARAVKHMKDTGNIFTDVEVDRSLQKGKVSDPENFMEESLANITSVNDFLVAAGLVEKKGDGEITPVSSVILRRMANLLKLTQQ